MSEIDAQEHGWRMLHALLSLAEESRISTDLLELLIAGDPVRRIPPGALGKAIAAYNRAGEEAQA